MTGEKGATADHIVEANKMVSATAEMPGERELAKLMMNQFYYDWFAPGKLAHNGSVYWDFVNGELAWSESARAILDLFAKVLANKDRERGQSDARWFEMAQKQADAFVAEVAARRAAEARALAAEAALAAERETTERLRYTLTEQRAQYEADRAAETKCGQMLAVALGAQKGRT